jgi:uncharacterized membrane protein YvlD (DUF360 family)
LAQSEPEGVVVTALADRLFYVIRYSIEAIRWARSSNALMNALVVVVRNPMVQPLSSVGE